VVVPDLPGFGGSRQVLQSYSGRAHAIYLRRLLPELGIERAHLVAFSMSGAAALHAADDDPGRFASISLIAAIGVQELELFGKHGLNHAVHGIQLAMIRLIDWLVPHFGAFDRFPLGIAYARNFYDTDQRPLRSILERYAAPMLIVHGRRDPLVPVAAAREHHRIVPQSDLVLLDQASHFILFRRTDWLAKQLDAFVGRVEQGVAPTRSQATLARSRLAAQPFDVSDVPPVHGVALFVLLIAIALSTFASEDLTCIGTGLLVAQGRIGFVAGASACVAGIFLGDLLLYLAGRVLGRPALRRRPLRWVVSAEAVERASAWFAANGPKAILISRFTPGLRLPTYVAAGVLRTHFWTFAFWFGIAALIWTPLLVGFAAWAGDMAATWIARLERWSLLAILGLALGLLALQRGLMPLLTHRGRRLWVGRWRRMTNFEYWPLSVVYAPVIAYVLRLAIRHRSLTAFTAVNPAIPHGGLVGESKPAILRSLEAAGAPVAPFETLLGAAPLEERVRRARAFMQRENLEFPVIVKPDAGERGAGVHIVRAASALAPALDSEPGDAIVQAFVPGPEYGVFWIRHPDQAHGRIFSITEKQLPEVVGDGQRSLERLILDDPRAVCMKDAYFARNARRLDEVIGAGQRIQLVDIGTHSRGAIFLDGRDLETPELAAAIERASLGLDGFYLGRYDVRSPSRAAFQAGEFTIIELNGLTSEATHIYDPRIGAREGWRTLCEQWALAFEIGAANAARGARTWSLLELWEIWRSARRRPRVELR
jgi:membrane protein DedA with SNARE-associated domain